MAKGKKRKRKRYNTRRRARRWFRKKDKRLPLSAGIGLGVSVFASPAPGWASAFESFQNGDYKGVLDAFVRSWTGIYGLTGKEPVGINIGGLLNPFDFSEAPALKSTIVTALAFKLVKKFLLKSDPFSKIPYLGKYVKMS